jgi:Mn-containing catalase
MFFHHRELAYTVRVDNPNPVFARMLQQAIGGPEGELRVMTQYMFQGFGYRGPKKYRDMLLATATEEIGHVEVLATAVAMNLEGAKSEMVDDVVTNVAAEAIGRTLATRLYELTDDPGMQDMLRFLIARDTMHQQQWLAVLEELGPEVATNAPGDFENEGEHAGHAYEFLNHLMDTPLPADARWTSGPSLDGKGSFTLVEPAPAFGQEPELQKAPPEVHAGIEATGDGGSVFGRFTRGLGSAVGKVTPGA